MQISIESMLIVLPLIFLAGFIDSIAGGGGLISLPAYLLAGLPIHTAYGTNKFSSAFGTTFSTLRFIKAKKVHGLSASVSAVGAIIGSSIGARMALIMDEKYLKYILLIALPIIAIIIYGKRDFGEKGNAFTMSPKKLVLLSLLISLSIGAYDGFIGPGTGTFLILAYTGIIGFDLTTAAGNTKITNLSSNIAALITFLIGGKVFIALAIPAALCGILGNWLGAGLALKNGAKIIKPMIITVFTLLFLQMIRDLFWA